MIGLPSSKFFAFSVLRIETESVVARLNYYESDVAPRFETDSYATRQTGTESGAARRNYYEFYVVLQN